MRPRLIKVLRSLGVYYQVKGARYSLGGDAQALAALAQRWKAARFYSQFIRKGDLCFDIGANLGNRTEIFLELGARVVCVEPQQACIDQLAKQFGVRDDMILVGKAVGAEEGHAELAVCDAAPTISTLFDKWRTDSRFAKGYQWARRERVPLTTLDALVASYGSPAFCKIDVEGSEVSVLKGLTLPLPALSFEFTGEFSDMAHECVDCILSTGPYEFQFSSGESMQFHFPQWVPPEKLYKGIESINDGLLWGDIYARRLPAKGSSTR